MMQTTESRVGFSSKSATTKIELGMRLVWEVTAANEQAFTVKQTIGEVQAKLQSAAGNAEFDSRASGRATGLAKQLAESLQPLVGAEVEVVFTPLGEVTSAKAVNDAARALFAREDRAGDAAAAPRISLAQLVSQSIVQLPEQEVAMGDKWTATRTIQSAAGPLTHVTTYALEDIQDQAAHIRTTGELAAEADVAKKPAAMRIKSHKHTGKIQFMLVTGRPDLVTQHQELTTERVYRDTTIEVVLTSEFKTTIANQEE
jgi:hypothetical protein